MSDTNRPGAQDWVDPQWRDDPAEETPTERAARNAAEREQLLREGVIKPYSNTSRILYGSWWTFLTALFVLAFFISTAAGAPGGMLVSLVVAGLCGQYAYRLWTWQARRLVFIFWI
jgi:hypothetical protein